MTLTFDLTLTSLGLLLLGSAFSLPVAQTPAGRSAQLAPTDELRRSLVELAYSPHIKFRSTLQRFIPGDPCSSEGNGVRAGSTYTNRINDEVVVLTPSQSICHHADGTLTLGPPGAPSLRSWAFLFRPARFALALADLLDSTALSVRSDGAIFMTVSDQTAYNLIYSECLPSTSPGSHAFTSLFADGGPMHDEGVSFGIAIELSAKRIHRIEVTAFTSGGTPPSLGPRQPNQVTAQPAKRDPAEKTEHYRFAADLTYAGPTIIRGGTAIDREILSSAIRHARIRTPTRVSTVEKAGLLDAPPSGRDQLPDRCAIEGVADGVAFRGHFRGQEFYSREGEIYWYTAEKGWVRRGIFGAHGGPAPFVLDLHALLDYLRSTDLSIIGVEHNEQNANSVRIGVSLSPSASIYAIDSKILPYPMGMSPSWTLYEDGRTSLVLCPFQVDILFEIDTERPTIQRMDILLYGTSTVSRQVLDAPWFPLDHVNDSTPVRRLPENAYTATLTVKLRPNSAPPGIPSGLELPETRERR